MFNAEREWTFMQHHRRMLLQQACFQRLRNEALRDEITLLARMLIALSDLMITVGTHLKARWWTPAEKPHIYVAPPQDRIYA
jgi:hypothetical protein